MSMTLSISLDSEISGLLDAHLQRVRAASPIPDGVKRSTVAKHMLREALKAAERKQQAAG